jgi:hypothetical protein
MGGCPLGSTDAQAALAAVGDNVRRMTAKDFRRIDAHPDVFAPESGAWGRAGCTRFQREAIDDETLGEAATLAWCNIATKATKDTKTVMPRRTRRSRKSKAASKRTDHA